MARHEFGIMEKTPISGIRYDEYEPEKYNCISIDDNYIVGIQELLLVLDNFCHTIDAPMKGLNYSGITLLPPTSVSAFLTVIGGGSEYAELRNLLTDAKKRNKFVIHFGL